MDSPRTKKGYDDGGSIEEVYQSFDNTFDFFSDELKSRFMAAMVRQSVISGNNNDTNSPRAKKLKTLVQFCQRIPEAERDSFVEAGITEYLNQKMSEKQVATKPPSASTATMPTKTNIQAPSPPSPLAHVPARTLTTPDSKPPPSQTIISSATAPTAPTALHSKPSPIQAKHTPDDVAESQHANVAAAMDFLGPAVLVKKTYRASSSIKSNIPKGWYIRQCECYCKSCRAVCLVWSPSRELGSCPAFVRVMNSAEHYAHRPMGWCDWYSYRDGKLTTEVDWNESTYPKRPGLPYFVRMSVQDILHFNPNTQPVTASRMVEQRFNDHPLLLNPGSVTERIMDQIQRFVRKSKNKKVDGISKTVKRIYYTGDVWEFIKLHRIDYDKLKKLSWQPQLRRGPTWLRAMAIRLRECEVLSGLGRYDHLPERDLIVLDSEEVVNDARWQFLKNAREKLHSTGPDPRRRTVVFSSIALLGNAVWCEDRKWEVSAFADATHGMSKSSYKLTTLGVCGFSESTGSRTVHPLVYIFGEGETEIVALHGFLNLKVALHRLFGIHEVCFKRGVVSDASPALINSVKRAFALSPLLSCYPHIIRKFMVDRKGNGHYGSSLETQTREWLVSEAQKAVRRCSFCKTKKQRDQMWKMTREKWNQDGESSLAETFARTYIQKENYGNWYYTASGQHGSVPCNNPLERHNLALKGSANFNGFVEIGKDFNTCLTKEFVNLVYRASTDLTFPTSGLPVLDFHTAMNNDLFMEFQSILDPTVDMKPYKNGWLINDVEYLTEEITDDDVKKMELALDGVMEDNADVEQLEDIRDIFLKRTMRFHVVKQAVWPTQHGHIHFFECDCREYYFHRWCYASAYMQHRDELRLLGKKIANNSTPTPKNKKYHALKKGLQVAALKKKQKKEWRKNIITK
jgi:hypothetical protein